MFVTTEKKFEKILIEEGATRALLETVEAQPGLHRLARRIRAELRMPEIRHPRIDPRRAARVLAAAQAADDAALAANLESLRAHFAH